MKLLPRRALLSACLALAGVALASGAAAWPVKPVRMMVPAPAGTAPDIMLRQIGEKLSALWGQPVVVENKFGAGGLIALTAVKNAEKDDHTFVFAPASVYALTPYMFKSPHVDIVRDFVPVAMVGIGPMMAAVSASSPANTLTDVIALARKDPDKFAVATTNAYSVPHLAVDMIGRAAGVSLRAVPFSNSGQSISAVVGGDAQMLIDGIPPIDALVKDKRLKPVAVFSDKRLHDRPQVPAAVEKFPSLVINGWFGVVALKGTRTEAIERVNRDLTTVLAMPDIVARFEALGVYPRPMTPQQFGQYWADERSRWEKVLRDVGAEITVTQ